MKVLGFHLTVLVAVCLVVPAASGQTPLEPGFTFQGRLKDGGHPANGTYDMEFHLYGDPNGLVWLDRHPDAGTVAVDVVSGLFTVTVEFDSEHFSGQKRWVETVVNSTALWPLQELTPTPYATYAAKNWALGGNAGTTPSTDFVGTTDNQALFLNVNDGPAMRLYPATMYGHPSPNVVGGRSNNVITAGVGAATISGGGGYGTPNQVSEFGGTVGGGEGNTAGNLDGDGWEQRFPTVAGGSHNTASRQYATVGGGWSNTASGSTATVPGGHVNTAAGICSFAAGAWANANHDFTFVWNDDWNSNFASTGPNQFLINADGGVGIGTNSPTAPLTVNGLIESLSGGFKFPDGSVQTTAGGGGGFWSASGNDIYNNNAGNVGIGTNDPQTALDVSSATTTAIRALAQTGTNGNYGTGIEAKGGLCGIRASAIGSGSGAQSGVEGWAINGSGCSTGVSGFANSSGHNYGVYGLAWGGAINWAGFFDGDVYIEGKIGIGTTNPQVPLDVETTSGNAANFKTTAYDVHAVHAECDHGSAVYGECAHGNGVRGKSTDDGAGVWGEGHVYGGYFEVDSRTGYAVYGENTSSNEWYNMPAIYGESDVTDFHGVGVKGVGGNTGVVGEVTPSGTNSAYGYIGVLGDVNGGVGANIGVYGRARGSITSCYGVEGYAYGSGINYGVYGIATSGTTNWAGYFGGDVYVLGTLTQGGGGGFKIDHPLDPENRYLYHSFVESPDMKNVYDGVVVLDDSGEAWVELPEWFETLNRDFRYQLTVIGGPMPDLYVAEEILENTFRIAGGEPGLKVSWQVTGIRQDPFAAANRIPVEEEKLPKDRGKYAHPAAYGLPEEIGIDYAEHEAAREKQEPVGHVLQADRQDVRRVEPALPASVSGEQNGGAR